MADRRSRQKRKGKEPPAEQEESTAQGWIRPRTAIIIIAVVALLNAANVFYAYFTRSANLTSTISFTFLAFVTPAVAAGLVYFIRRKLAG